MNSYIYMADLVANVLIERMENNKGREVRFSELREYEAKLVSWWSQKKRIQVTVLLSKYDTDEMLFNYSEFFSIQWVPNEDDFIISLNPGKTSEDLRKMFRPYLSIDMIRSFIESCHEITEGLITT